MDYQVWVKEEYGDNWTPEEVGDIEAAKRAVLLARQQGREVRLTVEVPFELQLSVGEPGAEAKKSRKKQIPTFEEVSKEEEPLETDQDPAEQD